MVYLIESLGQIDSAQIHSYSRLLHCGRQIRLQTIPFWKNKLGFFGYK